MSAKAAKQAQFDDLDVPRFVSWFGLTLCSMFFMELSWVVPWFQTLTSATLGSLTARAYLVFGLTLSLAFIVSKGVALFRLKPRIQLLLLAVFTAVNLIGALASLRTTPALGMAVSESVRDSSEGALVSPLSHGWVTVFFVLIGWWRGVGFAKNGLGPGQVLAKARVGMVLLFLYGFVTSSAAMEPVDVHFYIFLVAALLAMIGARMGTLHRLRGGRATPMDPSWLAGMGATATVVVGLAAVVAEVARGPVSDLVSGFVRAFLGWTSDLLAVLLAPILAVAVRAVVRLFHWLEQSIPPDAAQPPQVAPSAYEEFLKELQEAPPPAWAAEIFAWVRGVLLLVLALVFFWFLLSRLRGMRILGRGWELDERESLLGGETLAEKLRMAFQRRVGGMADSLRALSDRDRWLAASRIRRIYAQLMALSASLGRTRAASVTPLEFLPSLKDLFPSLESELETITHAYVQVRYGELPETRAEIESVERAWDRVHHLGRELYYREVDFLRA